MPLFKYCANRLMGVSVHAGEICAGTPQLVRRARPLLGTLVTIQVRLSANVFPGKDGLAHVYQIMDKAFCVIQDVERAMSAHSQDSDLARLARVVPGADVVLSRHTVAVLRLATYWYQTSQGAFDPVLAANRLAALDLRPAFRGLALAPQVTLRELSIIGDDTVRLERPMRLDLGGIAKGYAVDCAIAELAANGLGATLVNAGGDLRGSGAWAWPVQVRSADVPTRFKKMKGLHSVRNAALATSTGAQLNGEFVRTRRARLAHHWSSCTVHAPDCVTADALTKWGLQSGAQSPRLARVLRAHGASMWRT